MSKLVWDQTGEKTYEAGVSNGVIYPVDTDGSYGKGVAWNGLSSVSESPSGAEETKIFADNQKYLSLFSAEDFGATVEAYTYPEEFAICDGSAEITKGAYIGQQTRKSFGLCYKTQFGNDLLGNEYGYKLHIIYGCKASPSEKSYGTINDSPEAITFSWTITTTPVPVEGHSSTASVIIDSTKVANKDNLKKLEEILYGKDESSVGAGDGEDPRLPLPAEIVTILNAAG